MLRSVGRIGVAILSIAAFPSVAGPADAGEALSPGVPIERSIAPNTRHVFTVALSAGDLFRASLEELQSAETATVFAPDGTQILYATGIGVPSFTAVAIAPESGLYRLEISPWVAPEISPETGERFYQPPWTAKYRLRIDRPRTSTPSDREFIQAQESFQNGQRIVARLKKASLPEAAAAFAKALRWFQRSGATRSEAETLSALGLLYAVLSEYDRASDYLSLALEKWREIGDARVVHDTSWILFGIEENQGRPSAAFERGAALLSDARAAGDVEFEKLILPRLAGVAFELGDYQQRVTYSKDALDLERDPNSVSHAVALHELGWAYGSLDGGRLQREYDEQAAAILRSRGAKDQSARLSLAYILQKMTDAERARGEWQSALRLIREAEKLNQEAGANRQAAWKVGEEGIILSKLGQRALAIETVNRAISVLHELHDAQETSYRVHLCDIYAEDAQRDRAAGCYEDVLQSAPESHPVLSFLIGKGFQELGRTERALALFREFINAGQAAESPDYPLIREFNSGGYAAMGGYAAESPNYPDMVKDVARAERDAGLLDEARAHIEAALNRREAESLRIASPELRASFFSPAMGLNEVYVDVLMAQHQRATGEGHDAEALEASERDRARSLIASLGETARHIREGVDPALATRERALQTELNRVPASQPGARDELERLTSELKLLRGEIRQANPRYASLTEPAPLTVAEIRRDILAPDTALLEYALGEERGYLWVLTSGSLSSFVLPPRDTVEKAARRVYELLNARRTAPKGEKEAERNVRVAKADAAYPAAAQALSRMVLGPARGVLGTSRLLIVAEGALSYVPFSALPDPKTTQPLLNAHEVVRLPSAGALSALRAELTAGTTRPQSGVAVFADPVFSNNDERVGALRGKQPPPVYSRALARSLSGAGYSDSASLPRLVFSRREADRIAAAGQPGVVSRFVDFRASHAIALSPEMARYRVVHFATHGLVNDEYPELSGIVLSMVDENGKAQDGFLRLHEIYNLRLPADLVVLSACETALGKEVRGEGMASLSRGFLYAGAARVIASLWKVDDAATAELMGRFYHKLLSEHLRPAAALRQAQLEMEQQERWHFPYHWAAFELQGEWK